jgi:hypothetical protein
MAFPSTSPGRRPSRRCVIFLEPLESRYAPASLATPPLLSSSEGAFLTTESAIHLAIPMTPDRGATGNQALQKPDGPAAANYAGWIDSKSTAVSAPFGTAAVAKHPNDDDQGGRHADSDDDFRAVVPSNTVPPGPYTAAAVGTETSPRLSNNDNVGTSAGLDSFLLHALPSLSSKDSAARAVSVPGPTNAIAEPGQNLGNDASIAVSRGVSQENASVQVDVGNQGLSLPGPQTGVLALGGLPIDVAALERALRDFVDGAGEVRQTFASWFNTPGAWAWLFMGSAVMVVSAEAIHRRLARRAHAAALLSVCEQAVHSTAYSDGIQ